MSPNPSHTLAARLAGRLRVVALLALLLMHIQPVLAGRAAAPAERAPAAQMAGPTLVAAGVTATQVDALLADTNGNGRADPGDKLRYTVAIDNTSGAEIAGLTFDATLDPSTALVPGSVRVSPLAHPDSYAANRGAVLAIAAPGLLANDSGTPAPSVTAGGVATAAGGTAAISADGSFSYTPPPGYTGIDSFSYSVNNLAGSDTAMVTLTVRAVPVAADDSYTVVQDSTRSIAAPGVLANDTGFPPPSVTPFNGSTSAGGSVTIAADGGFSYSPASGYTGDDTFVYTASNAAGSDTATVTMTVGIAPLAQDDTGYTTVLGAPLSVAAGTGVLQNDTLGSPAAQVLSFGGGDLGGNITSNAAGTTASFGSGGALKLMAAGGFEFTPSAGFAGAFSFGYRIGNPFGTSDAVATIAVQQLPAITSADAITFTVGVTGSFSITTIGFPTPAVTRSGALPNGVTFVDNGDGTGTLGGVPAAGGSYPLVFSASNSAGNSPPQSFTLVVQQGPAITSAASAAFEIGVSGTFTVTASGYPTPTIARLGALPAGVSFVDNGDGTATLSGTPAGPSGAYPLSFSATNSAGTSAAQSFALIVGQAPEITSVDSVTFTLGLLETFTITTTGFPAAAITQTGALPNGVTFVDNGDGTGTLGGMPAAAGSYPLTFGASNLFGASASQAFTLTVQAAVPKARGAQSTAAPLSVSVGALPAGRRVTITYDVAIADPLPQGVSRLANQGTVSGGGLAGVLTDDPRRPGAVDPTITFVGTRRVFIPLLFRASGPPAADLVVERIASAGGTVSITIRNDGSAPVVDAFWIDLYIGPTSPPVRANQLWSDVGSRGATWGVADSALPLASGARLTVALGDTYYRPQLSNLGGAIAAGTQLYAQVDSFNPNSANGAVLEAHERDGQAYNNILGPVAAGAP